MQAWKGEAARSRESERAGWGKEGWAWACKRGWARRLGRLQTPALLRYVLFSPPSHRALAAFSALRQYPMTAYVVTGTQADQGHNNKVLVMKMSQLVKTKAKDGKAGRLNN